MTKAAAIIDLRASKTQSPKSFVYTTTVKTHLGEQLSLIVSTLISHGRLNIQQLSSYTNLPIYNIKQSLVSLIQLNIVTYFAEFQKKPFYSFNELGVLKLVYSGDIIHQIHLIYQDETITKIIQNFLNFGYLTFQDYSSDKDSEKLVLVFIKLIQDKWLIPINKISFQDKFDLYNELFKQQLVKFNKESKATSESKKILEVKQITNTLFLDLITPKVKYSKIVNGEERLIKDIPFTFNLNRFLQRKRSLLLLDLCKHKLGPLSLKIYSIILNKFEKNSIDVINEMLDILKHSNNIMVTSTGLDPLSMETVKEGYAQKNIKLTSHNANDIVRELHFYNKDKMVINVRHSIISPLSLQRDDEPARKKIKLEIPEDGDLNRSDFEDDDTSIVMQHLKILAQNKFLKESSPGKFYVPFDDINDLLQQETLNQLIKLIFGQDALRIINCIKNLKLIDEKMINNILLMKDATIRSNLNKLVMSNILQLQEIPKTNDRLAIRTVFTFKFNYLHVSQQLINSFYYNLGEILENIEQVKLENKILLDKCNRDDVKGKELEVLIESELIKLNEIYEAQTNDLKKFIRILSLIEVFEL